MADRGAQNDAVSANALDMNILREIAKKSLVDALNSVNGAKTLVLDASIAGPLGLVTEVSLLKHHGVDKMFWLEPGPLTATTTNIVYLSRPSVKLTKIIADQIKRHGRESQKRNYTLILVPRPSTLVSRILEEEGVLGEVNISAYNLQFIPLADDVISLERDNAFKELWVDGDETMIYDSAQALISLQNLYGTFPRIVGKGHLASRLAALLAKPASKASGPSSSDSLLASPVIDSLIVFDRRVDMITPFLTQLTYEGLVDELIGIRNSHVELPVSLLTPASAQTTPNTASTSQQPSAAPIIVKKESKKKHHLTTLTDPLFAELRDLNFSAVGRRLNKVAHRLDEDYKTNLQSKTVAQLRDFVGKLGGLQTEHQALRLHTGLSEMLLPFTRTEQFNKSLEIQQNLLASYEANSQIAAIEEMISQGAELQVILRLLCLASITTGGIKTKVLENLKREILQSYGYEYLPLLLSLATPPLGVLLSTPLPPSTAATIPTSKYPYAALRKSLRLLIDDNPEALEEVENDISYVYSGYAPISIRLVQCIAQKGGVLSNPAEKEKGPSEANAGAPKTSGKVHAHPIVGWKGFEDVVEAIPGETIDIVLNHPERGASSGLPITNIRK
ncbi:ATP binding protein [Macrolepiota fuliginosa MF-IS2]|uniref:ATP binding protein n=1 Tax=Macrolepiota fuliginosa MF-IS2 TaxID=1400762 RepID=A0A9P5XHB6_9AGAR|nr:ATP binding protein [Macrolepiota fuliginosa MF-IS2]